MNLNNYLPTRRKKPGLFFLSTVLLFFFQMVIPGPSLSAETEPGSTNRYIEAIKLFEEYVKEKMPIDQGVGFAVGFMKDDMVWTKGFGFADLENNTPLQADGSFRMASITKTYTAIGILQLVEKGKIDLDAEVQVYVPYFPRKKWPVTVRLLLGHLGGISHYKDYDQEGHIKVHKNTKEALAIFSDFDLVAEPGTRYSYSSYGFNLLGAVIEGASGQSYGDYIREHIFTPLGMENSRLDDPVELISNRVRGYQRINGQVKNSEYVDMSSRFAGGGTRSTVPDMLIFAKGFMENKLVKEETRRMMLTSMATRSGFLTGYGMGWSVGTLHGHFRAGHGGAQQETSTYLLMIPSKKFALVVAANLEGFNHNPYIIRLTELVLDIDIDSSAYSGQRESQTILSACKQVFTSGLGYYDWANAPLTRTDQELKEAFTFFNRWVDIAALKKNFKETKKQIDSGIHPASKEAFTAIGSFMADSLKEAYGEGAIQKYQQEGVFAFFRDFIDLCRKPQHKKDFAFTGKFRQLFAGWLRDWNKTYTDEVRRLVITPKTDFKELAARLKKIFTGARVYPDFTVDLEGTGRIFLFRDEVDKAFEIFSVNRELYPDSPGSLIHLAAAYLWKGQIPPARDLLKKAFQLDPQDRPDWLRWMTYRLEEMKKTDSLLGLASIALELYPQNPQVYKAVGDIYLNAGKRKEAEDYYRKAIGFGLDFSQVKEILDELNKAPGAS